ncbi:MAG: carbohydrate-binding protein [Porticoccaceae bacterium]
MFAKKVLIALSLPLLFSLSACGGDGGGGDADQNVVRNIFAVGDILEAREDSSGVSGNVCENDLPDTCELADGSPQKLLFALKKGEAMESGSFSFCADGTYKYTPSEFFTGSESIDYTYSGEGTFGVGTLDINIVEAGEVKAGSVSNTNLHGDGVTYALAAGEAAENGSLVFCHNGDVEYTPVQDFYGVESLDYVASLNGDISTATLTINVANDFETLDEYGWNLEWSHDFTEPGEFNLGLWDGDNISLSEEGLKINPNDNLKPSLTSLQTIGEERGRIEAKIKTATSVDVMSVFKLVPVNESYDGNNSLKIMLAKDGTMTAGAHYGLDRISGVIINETIQATASDEWHTYAIEWGEKKIRWYIDGTHVYTVDTLNLWAYNQSGENLRGDEIIANTTTYFDQRTPDPLSDRKPGPFDQSMQIVFDLQAQPENKTAEMLVEYVKVWSCDPSVEPSIDECASNEKLKISRAASDRIETVGFEKTIFFADGNIDPATKEFSEFNPLSWHYWKNEFELNITKYGSPVVTYPVLDDENDLVIDFNNRSGISNINIGTESAELNGYDISLNFDLYVDSAKTDVEIIKIKMQSGNSGDNSANDLAAIEAAISLDELELDEWNSLSFNIPEDFNTVSEGSLEFNPNDITSFMILEVDSKAHLQLDNIHLGCINSEGCIQGPMAMQTPPAPEAIPIRIEAETENLEAENPDNDKYFVSESGIEYFDVLAPSEGGGEYVGDVNDGDSISYKFDAPAIGPYSIDYRVSSFGGSEGFNVELDGSPLHSVSIDDTGGWEEWVTLTSPEFELLSGVKTIEIKFVGDNQNLNWLEIQPPLGEFKIWADEFDIIGGPNIKLEKESDDNDSRTGQNIGYVKSPDDYVEYTVFIPSSGSYLIEYRVAGEYDSRGFDVLLDDILIDTQGLENPRGWQEWDTQSSAVEGLTKGEKTMRLNFYGDPINTNWIKFTRIAPNDANGE